MARKTVWIPVVILAYALPATAAGVCEPSSQTHPKTERSSQNRNEQRSRWKWWLHDRAELGITDEQSTEIDRIFESTIPQQRETRRELDQMEKALEKMIEEGTADVTTVEQQVDKVETL